MISISRQEWKNGQKWMRNLSEIHHEPMQTRVLEILKWEDGSQVWLFNRANKIGGGTAMKFLEGLLQTLPWPKAWLNSQGFDGILDKITFFNEHYKIIYPVQIY